MDDNQQVQRVYANFTGLGGGPFDLVLNFGFRLGDEVPEPVIQVAMSWEHALALSTLLQTQLDAYQAELGPLPNIDKAKVEEVKEPS